jgi:hypothetical protein
MSTPKKIQFAGGLTAAEDAYTGLIREIRFDTQRGELRAHDGVIPGGHRIPNLDTVSAAIATALSGGSLIVGMAASSALLASFQPIGTNVIVFETGTAIGDDFAGVWFWKSGVAPTNTRGIVASTVDGYWTNLLYGFSRNNVADSISDFNTNRGDGIYFGTNATANTPDGGTVPNWSLFHGANSLTGFDLAVAMVNATPELWIRSRIANVNGAWFKLHTQGVTVDTFGAVGTYMFAKTSGGTIAPGSTTPGSNLLPSDDAGTTAGAAPSGTWKAMGAGTTLRATLWVRSA